MIKTHTFLLNVQHFFVTWQSEKRRNNLSSLLEYYLKTR